MKATITVGQPDVPEKKTLADLDSGVLATVRLDGSLSERLRWRDREWVLGLSGDEGEAGHPIVLYGNKPEEYTVVKVHGLIAAKFGD